MEKRYLNWNVRSILDRLELKRAAVAKEAGLHPDIVGQMYDNRASRVGLKSLARLARVLGVGIAPAPDGTPGVGAGLLRWDGDRLEWRLRELRERGGETIRDLFFITEAERTTLERLDQGTATQVSLATLEVLARHYGVGLAESPYGAAPTYLLVWGPPREAATRQEPDERPIPGEPSKVCHCKVCTAIDPAGVEKRISAFPKSAKYKYGVGPICKKGRQQQEKERRAALREEHEAEKARAQAAAAAAARP